jgi:hypothetical protein
MTNDMLEVPESIAIFVLMLLFVLLNVVQPSAHCRKGSLCSHHH